MPPDEPNDEERQEELPEDYQTPFRPADPSSTDDTITSKPDDTHPITDTGLDSQELYDEGIAEGAGVEEPTKDNDVTSYNPDQDKSL
jgi:hypothetical protein